MQKHYLVAWNNQGFFWQYGYPNDSMEIKEVYKIEDIQTQRLNEFENELSKKVNDFENLINFFKYSSMFLSFVVIIYIFKCNQIK